MQKKKKQMDAVFVINAGEECYRQVIREWFNYFSYSHEWYIYNIALWSATCFLVTLMRPDLDIKFGVNVFNDNHLFV